MSNRDLQVYEGLRENLRKIRENAEASGRQDIAGFVDSSNALTIGLFITLGYILLQKMHLRYSGITDKQENTYQWAIRSAIYQKQKLYLLSNNSKKD